MVGWSRRNSESAERARKAREKEEACIAGGCKCYCHAPKKEESIGFSILVLLLAYAVVVGGLLLIKYLGGYK